MLNYLTIKNFAIIEDLSINFQKGYNAIVGETGAGKSIIIAALGQLMGDRSDFNKIRLNKDKAIIEGEFLIDNPLIIEKINHTYDDLIEDNILRVTRILDNTGKTTIKINAKVMPMSALKFVMAEVLDIHSQHLNDKYLNPNSQLEVLDQYILSSNESKDEFFLAMNDYQSDYKTYIQIKKEIEKIHEFAKNSEDLDYLTYQYNELEKANIQEHELEDLEDKVRLLSSIKTLSDKYQEFEANFNASTDALYDAKKALSMINYDEFDEPIQKFNEHYYELLDAHDQIEKIFAIYKEQSYQLEQLTERLHLLRGFKRKYGSTTEEILAKFEELRNQIDAITNLDYLLNKKQTELNTIIDQLTVKAEILHSLRVKGSEVLAKNINQQIKDLLLINADFIIDLEQLQEFNKAGIEKATFLLRANLGGKYLPLKETASLGETSRINLALKNVFNQLNPVETIIFDEVDTGVSGKVAAALARKIKSISKVSQTIVITHLPQVLAAQDHTYRVYKEVIDDVTKTSIIELDEKAILEEIGKMISNEDYSIEAIKTAKNLLKELKD